jgi:hypothetical protein
VSSEKRSQQLVTALEVGDDEVGADAYEALALPLVDDQALRLGGRHAHGDAADFLYAT